MNKMIYFLLSIFFLVRSYAFAEDIEAMIQRAKAMTDWTKPNYDAQAVQVLFESIINNEDNHLYYRLEACYEYSILFLQRGPDVRNKAKGRYYLKKYLELNGNFFSPFLFNVKTDLTIGDKANYTLRIDLYLWFIEAIFSEGLIDNVLLKPDAVTPEAKQKEHLILVKKFLNAQDLLLNFYMANLSNSNKEFQNLVRELGITVDKNPKKRIQARQEFIEKKIREKYGQKNKSVVQRPPVLSEQMIQATFLRELLEPSPSQVERYEFIQKLLKYLEDNSQLPESKVEGEGWVSNIRVCDVAALALEKNLKGKPISWEEKNQIGPRLRYDYRYEFYDLNERLIYWKDWKAKNQNKSLKEMAIILIEEALQNPIAKSDKFLGIKINSSLGDVLKLWTGWDFAVPSRLFITKDKPEAIVKDIKIWWDAQKDADINNWQESAKELKKSEYYQKMMEVISKEQRVLETAYQKARMELGQTLQKELPEEFKFYGESQLLLMNKENLEKTIEVIKKLRLKAEDTISQEMMLSVEQKYMRVLELFVDR